MPVCCLHRAVHANGLLMAVLVVMFGSACGIYVEAPGTEVPEGAVVPDAGLDGNEDFTDTSVADPDAAETVTDQNATAGEPVTETSITKSVKGADLASYTVIDGDSVEGKLADGSFLDLRIVDFNAPELYDFNDQKTCNGLAAKNSLMDFLKSGSIGVELKGQDRYGRDLAQLWVAERSAADHMVANGWGLASGRDESARHYRDLMQVAASQAKGVWGAQCGTPSYADLVIGQVQADPAGNDLYNLVEEWVEIVNTGARPVLLDGWILRDEATSHRFELSGLLEAGAALKVRTGYGDDSDTDRYLNERYPVWTNSDETVILADPAGVFVDWRFLR